MKTAADACVVYDLKRSKWSFKHEDPPWRFNSVLYRHTQGKTLEACTPGATSYVPWHLSDDAIFGTWGWHAVGRTYHKENQSRQLFLWKQRQLSCCQCVLICHTVMMRSWSLVALCVNLNDLYKPHVPNSRNIWRFWIAKITYSLLKASSSCKCPSRELHSYFYPPK